LIIDFYGVGRNKECRLSRFSLSFYKITGNIVAIGVGEGGGGWGGLFGKIFIFGVPFGLWRLKDDKGVEMDIWMGFLSLWHFLGG
jgi:hypothetical protein